MDSPPRRGRRHRRPRTAADLRRLQWTARLFTAIAVALIVAGLISMRVIPIG